MCGKLVAALVLRTLARSNGLRKHIGEARDVKLKLAVASLECTKELEDCLDKCIVNMEATFQKLAGLKRTNPTIDAVRLVVDNGKVAVESCLRYCSTAVGLPRCQWGSVQQCCSQVA